MPKVIYDALREAGALVQTHLDTLQGRAGSKSILHPLGNGTFSPGSMGL